MKKTIINLDIFEMQLTVYEYWTREQIEKEISKIEKRYDKVIDFDLWSSIAFHFQIDQDLFIFRNTKELPILVHEVYHAVSSIYNTIGMPMSKENDELGAYLISYILRQLKI